MSNPEFDVIVVGSGITGGWAAKELTERGLSTLMLERGRPVVHGQDYHGENKPIYSFPFRLLGDKRRYTEEIPQQIKSGWVTEATDQFFVDDRLNPYTCAPERPFIWIRGHQLGGRSLTWGRQSYRLSGLNFEENARDGFGCDWPIRYEDLEPWYATVEKFIGVSGEALGNPQSPDGVYQPPMAMNLPERIFAEQLAHSYPNRRLSVARLANLTASLSGRAPCQLRDNCARGCSWGGYFSTLSSTLPAARATGRLTLRTDSIVHSVIYDPKRRRAAGVRVIDAKTHATREYRARLVVLCASAFESVRIMLNSSSEDFPTGIANSSGTLGKFIMDHHPSHVALADVEGPRLKTYRGGRPGPLFMPRFVNLDEERRDFVRGYQINAFAYPQGWQRGLSMPGFGPDFKHSLRSTNQWTMLMIAQCEMLPNEKNMLRLDASVKDAWGVPALHIDVQFGDNDRKMARDATREVTDMMERGAGTKPNVIPIDAIPGGTIHEMGGARMGRNPKDSVLNGWNQTHDVKNLLVTDGAAMTSSSCANPSLTYMALTARACAHAVEELKQGKI
jgi:choline dehydrogenase-like flavoprotein